MENILYTTVNTFLLFIPGILGVIIFQIIAFGRILPNIKNFFLYSFALSYVVLLTYPKFHGRIPFVYTTLFKRLLLIEKPNINDEFLNPKIIFDSAEGQLWTDGYFSTIIPYAICISVLAAVIYKIIEKLIKITNKD